MAIVIQNRKPDYGSGHNAGASSEAFARRLHYRQSLGYANCRTAIGGEACRSVSLRPYRKNKAVKISDHANGPNHGEMLIV